MTAGSMACIVLAAGRGERFGADKRLAAVHHQQTLLDLTLASVPASFHQRILVLQPGDQILAARYGTNWSCLFAENARSGLGYSLAAGLSRATGCSAALVVLGDMPCVTQQTYRQLIAQLAQDRLVVPCYQGQRGNPVGIGARFFPELGTPKGDSGARGLFGRYPDAVLEVEVGDPGILQDVDSREALEALRGRLLAEERIRD